MAAPPKTKRGLITRNKILDAAKSEIGEKGFSEASVSSITAVAGVGQGTFYIYFDSKEDVLRELVLEMGKAVRRHLHNAVDPTTSRLEAERQGLLAFLEFVRENKELYCIVHESQFVDPDIHRQYYEAFAESYRHRLESAGKTGEIKAKDPEVCSWALMGIGEFLGLRYGLWDTETPIETVVDSVFDLIFHGMKP